MYMPAGPRPARPLHPGSYPRRGRRHGHPRGYIMSIDLSAMRDTAAAAMAVALRAHEDPDVRREAIRLKAEAERDARLAVFGSGGPPGPEELSAVNVVRVYGNRLRPLLGPDGTDTLPLEKRRAFKRLRDLMAGPAWEY